MGDFRFDQDGLHFVDDEGVVVASFRFDADWDLNTVECGGEILSAEMGFEDERIEKWMAEQPDYGFASFGDVQVAVITHAIAFGSMYIVCVMDRDDVVPARVLAKVICYEGFGQAAGNWSISLFDGDEERDFQTELRRYDGDVGYSFLP